VQILIGEILIFKGFLNSITKEKKISVSWVFHGPCHAIKLIRSVLGDKLILRYDENKFIVSLQNLQETEGLKAAKLTKKHIMYKNNKMKCQSCSLSLVKMSIQLKFVNQLYPKQSSKRDSFILLNV